MNKLFGTVELAFIIAITIFCLQVEVGRAEQALNLINEKETVFQVKVQPLLFQSVVPTTPVLAEVVSRDYVTVRSPVIADVLSINYKEGEEVAANKSVLNLDLSDIVYDLQIASLSLEESRLSQQQLQKEQNNRLRQLLASEERLQLSEQNVIRDSQLQQQGVISEEELRNVQIALLQNQQAHAELKVQVANHSLTQELAQNNIIRASLVLNKTQYDYQQARLLTPFDATIARVYLARGAEVNPSQTLLEMYRKDSLQLSALLPLRHVNHLQRGQTYAQIDIAGISYQLTLTMLEQISDAGSAGVVGYFSLPDNLPDNKLILGQNHNLQLNLPELEGVYVLPYSALYTGNRIYVVDSDKRAKSIPCELLGSKSVALQTVILRCNQDIAEELVVVTRRADLIEGAKLEIVN